MKIRLGTDLEELVTLRPDRTMTTWSPEFFPGGEAFWLEGKADCDRTAFVIAARVFRCDDLHVELKTLKFFYLEPERFQDLCEVQFSDVPPVLGNTAHTGNLWVADEFRGQGLGGIVTRLLHREILRRWDVDYIWGLQERELAYKGLWQDQGYPHCDGDVTWSHNPYGREFRMKVVWGTADQISQSL